MSTFGSEKSPKVDVAVKLSAFPKQVKEVGERLSDGSAAV